MSTSTLFTLLPQVLWDFRASWRSLLATHLLYTLIASAMLIPLTTWLLHMLVAQSGSGALSDFDIVFFLSQPAGLIALVTITPLIFAIIALEHAALLTIAFQASHGYGVKPWTVLGFVVQRSGSILHLACHIFVRLLLTGLPFLAVSAGIYFWLLSEHDINYYLTEKPPVFWVAMLLIGGFLFTLLMLLVKRIISWIFALPLLLFERIPTKDALSTSHRITAEKYWLLTGWLLAWLLANSVLAGIITGIIATTAWFLVPRMAESVSLLALLLGGFMVLSGLVNFLLAFVSVATLNVLVIRLYRWRGFGDDHNLTEFNHTEADGHGVWSFRLTGKVVALACLFIVIASGWLGYSLIQGLTFKDQAEILAHRGASAAAPENTLAAIERAIAEGADWVEIDVQQTADGEVVVIHDSDLQKVAGIDLKISNATTPQLQAIDIGSWFAPEFSDQRIPTLRQVLLACKGRIGVDIELKYYGHEVNLEERVVALVEATDMTDQIMIMSLRYSGIQKIRALRPSWKIGLLTSVNLGNIANLDVDFFAVNAQFLTYSFIKKAHGRGQQVFVWTVNDAFGFSAMLSRDVDGIITDKPALAIDILNQRAQLSAPEFLLVELAGLFDTKQTYRVKGTSIRRRL